MATLSELAAAAWAEAEAEAETDRQQARQALRDDATAVLRAWAGDDADAVVAAVTPAVVQLRHRRVVVGDGGGVFLAVSPDGDPEVRVVTRNADGGWSRGPAVASLAALGAVLRDGDG